MGYRRNTQYFLLILLAYLQHTLCLESDKKPTVAWIRPGILTHQSLHSVLVSMEERLRGLEHMKYTTNRLDLYLEQFSRQLDSLDVRTRAVQIKLEQLETVAQNLVSHELKNDLSTVQLQRKFETNQDRLIHKISLTENRLDSSITKLQGATDLGMEKMEKKQNEFQNKLNNFGAVLDSVSQRIIKIEDFTNATLSEIHQNKISDLQHSRHHQIAGLLERVEKHVNKSVMLSDQNDSPRTTVRNGDQMKELFRTELHSEANKVTNKINNMYNDIWSKMATVETLIKDAVNVSDVARVRSQEHTGSTSDDIKCSETIENVMGEIVGTLGGFLQEKLDSMDTNLEGVFATHKMLLGAYNKMREDENQFEAKLTFVLGKILDTLENRTKLVDEVQKKTLEALKSHNSQVTRTVAYNTNYLKKLAEDSGVEHKNLDNALIQLLNLVTQDKHESQEYEDNINEPVQNKVKQAEEKKTTLENLPDLTSNDKQTVPNKHRIVPNVTQNSVPKPLNKTEEETIEHTPDTINFVDENITSEHSDGRDRKPEPKSLDDELAVTRLLMLYLKTLKGHLSKDKFLYEANPQHPYSSVQAMIQKLKEKNFPVNFLKELEEWDMETNDKEDVKDFTDNPNEDYYPDKDYLDYPVEDTN